ncbi:hypothetical protein [Geothrix sp. 21YS21S-2]|uniref:hypothetical protein n=1 Tax=Geothrix sp. 21YS21S-2 TaxID=3068893 RepID=UPI0027B8DCD9|nr:hypothetical protein [Geothrix sp. 21YS21S-2]
MFKAALILAALAGDTQQLVEAGAARPAGLGVPACAINPFPEAGAVQEVVICAPGDQEVLAIADEGASLARSYYYFDAEVTGASPADCRFEVREGGSVLGPGEGGTFRGLAGARPGHLVALYYPPFSSPATKPRPLTVRAVCDSDPDRFDERGFILVRKPSGLEERVARGAELQRERPTAATYRFPDEESRER